MINGSVQLTWGDGEHTFNIAVIAQMLELEEKCDAGVYEIFQRLTTGRARLNDIRETIRLGLIGGGKTPIQALSLVKRYVDNRPLAESVPVATALLLTAIVGVPGDEVGKKPEAEGAETEAAASPAPHSTASEPQSDSIPERLTNSPSGNSQPASMDGTESTDQSQASLSL
jgi:hypothetical protein